MINGLKYVAPIYDETGYAEAARNYLYGLITYTDIPVTISPMFIDNFNDAPPDLSTIKNRLESFGDVGRTLLPYINSNIEYDVVMVHCTPKWFHGYHNNKPLVEKNKINIGMTAWETDKLPRLWVNWFNGMDAMITFCTFSRDVFIKDCTIPVFCVPHIVTINDISNGTSTIDLSQYDDHYKFLSIFQWTPRKNPIKLLQAYLAEFSYDEKVILVLKTYLSKMSSVRDARVIHEYISRVKYGLARDEHDYPPIILINKFLNRDEIFDLYRECDIFILPSHGEGFGLPYAEAILSGTPCIALNKGGHTDFVNSANSLLVPAYEDIVCDIPESPWYRSEQKWFDCTIHDLMRTMRYAYENRFISSGNLPDFSPQTVTNQLVDIIDKVVRDAR